MTPERKTVLITGASSGIGLATARLFAERGWNVVATMRNPEERETPLHDMAGVALAHLDVTDRASIAAAVGRAIDAHGRIDVLVNNAGYGLHGPFEASTSAQVARQYATNVFGLMEMTREVLPLMRSAGGGVVVSVSSMGGRVGFPLYSLYNGTKWAVEGFSEALQYELRPLGIRVKLVEPGVIDTDFYGRSAEEADCATCEGAYDDILRRGGKRTSGSAARGGTQPEVVARTIYRAGTDGTRRLRYPVGGDARAVWLLRRLLPERAFFRLLERLVLD